MIINQISKHALVSCLLFLVSLGHAAKKEGEWIQLFNGKDLSDWTVKIRGHEAGVNHNDTFSVKDGVIRVSYDKYENFNETFGHMFYKTPFSHYLLRIEYRFLATKLRVVWLGFRNSGVASRPNPRKHGQGQDFPDSIEFSFSMGRVKASGPPQHVYPRYGRRDEQKIAQASLHRQQSKTYHGDQWVTVEIEVRGSKSIKHVIDGETVLEYTKPQLDDGALLDGTISLQSESHPVEFRKVELKLSGGKPR